ncbi:MAG: hypothetical protein AVDCRST_MAG30-1373, partial [uncultured Solirubrobacteraceae bacterium]
CAASRRPCSSPPWLSPSRAAGRSARTTRSRRWSATRSRWTACGTASRCSARSTRASHRTGRSTPGARPGAAPGCSRRSSRSATGRTSAAGRPRGSSSRTPSARRTRGSRSRRRTRWATGGRRSNPGDACRSRTARPTGRCRARRCSSRSLPPRWATARSCSRCAIRAGPATACGACSSTS